ncbi:uncharacterized protein LOC131229560 [Magnolia sinica]|uniref:uncharacterized protein LOC131229560 n=1 Tax=Magnolia sinica TaxID=86752 RepID=UPI00265ABDA0|nr:uncharacterized protein LOC131229560 [Magnolia sinica]
MKKVFGFWVLFMTVGAVLVFLSFSSSSSGSLGEDLLVGNAGSVFPVHEENMKAAMTNRKLKENSYDWSGSTEKGESGDLNLEDYHSIDPVPSSRASIKTGPIEHGTPVIPYIPRPTPPSHPGHGGSP